MKTLVLGGVRSGKSRLAAGLASDTGRPVVYVATARGEDEAMRARIEQHKRDRPAHWRVVEEPVHLASALNRHDTEEAVLLVDCLTLWVTNLLCAEDDELLDAQLPALIDHVTNSRSDIVLVSNETSMGVVPMDALSRRFCDETGLLHQRLAGVCDTVILAVAGLPHTLKAPGTGR